ncbi:glycosyltransferase [Winogradskyella poriferorum]|uniref:glycosyltransferase n=1 Tax=Winogradskyella poriferorum TaxID=307627 RepID=UPI003D648D19
MRIAVLIYSLASGGAERVVSYLSHYFIEKDIEIHLVLMNSTIKYTIPNDLKIHYLENSDSNESGIFKALKIPLLALRYSKLLSDLEITHSCSFLTRPNFINILANKTRRSGIRVICNERAFPSLQYNYSGFQSIFNKWLISFLYKKSDLVVGNSNENIEDLITNFNVPQIKTCVIHNPIDLKTIEKIKPLDNFFDNRYFNIITIGRLDQGKNHEMLINSIQNLSNQSTRLYIFGEGPLRGYLKNLIKELGLDDQVFLMGYEPNPFKYLKSADLFIFGSNHEGFPNVLLEAMACNLPVLTTNCQSGPKEIMELKESLNDLMITNYGILVPVNNQSLMTKGIKYFLKDNSFSESCKTNVYTRVKDFEKYKVLKRYVKVINNLDRNY